ncbi:MAG: SGNH/GDSL hydrolase family protein [Gammaproteobacteria bacterium]|nr:SGNH/GDSL hydrolase family protein [Gammaproteobacteria bacterium]
MSDWWKYLILFVVILAPLEIASFLAARWMVPLGIVILPPKEDGYAAYLASRDPVLGWPRPDAIGAEEFDSRGSRIIPNFPSIFAHVCVSTYGDSFTWGADVGPDGAYANALANLLGCRVENFGVGGYGTDQALLRYVNNQDDHAPVVVLGHFSENIVRNVNQLRDFYASGRFGFKPRFILNQADELQLVPLPTLSVDEYLSVHRHTDSLLPYEYFAPNTKGAPAVFGFPYTLTVVRALFHYRIQARLRGQPSYAAFYEPGHPSGGLAVTEGIILEFVETARQRGQQALVMIIPDIKDLEMLRGGHGAPYDPLETLLAQAGIDSIDAGRGILALLGDRDICDLYVSCPTSHFSAEGYAMLAQLVHERITKLPDFQIGNPGNSQQPDH